MLVFFCGQTFNVIRLQAAGEYQTGIQYVQPVTTAATDSTAAAENSGSAIPQWINGFKADPKASAETNLENFLHNYDGGAKSGEKIENKIMLGFIKLYDFLQRNILMMAFIWLLLGAAIMLVSTLGIFRRGFATGLKFLAVAFAVMVFVPSAVTIGLNVMHWAD